MKNLILICLGAMLISAPIFAQSGSSQTPSGTDYGAGSMSQPSGTQPSGTNMDSGSTQQPTQQMEDQSMHPTHGAGVGTGASPGTGVGTGSDLSNEEDKTSP